MVEIFQTETLKQKLPLCPAEPVGTNRDHQLRMIDEEAFELRRALLDRDLEGIVDGCGDLIYVLFGVLSNCGLTSREIVAVLCEIAQANSEKIHDPTCADGGKPVKKPVGWKEPRIRDIIWQMGGI